MSSERPIDWLLGASPPEVSHEAARQIASATFGLIGDVLPLGGELDRNFVLMADGRRYVLKINSVLPESVLDCQCELLLHLERTSPDLPIPRVVSTRAGRAYAAIDLPGGVAYARVLSFLEGASLHSREADIRLLHDLGQRIGQLAVALSSFKHSADRRAILWDLRQSLHLKRLLGSVSDLDRRELARRQIDAFAPSIANADETLPRQVVHNDITPRNLLFDQEHGQITGIIDFGDAVHSWSVSEIAIACAYHIRPDDNELVLASSLLAGFESVRPLAEVEREMLLPLIQLRLAQILVITEWRAAMHPDNGQYILQNNFRAWLALKALASWPEKDVRRKLLGNRDNAIRALADLRLP